MPDFSNVDPDEVQTSRELRTDRLLQPYIDTLEGGVAGVIMLSQGEKAGTIARNLKRAAEKIGVKVATSLSDDVVQWKIKARAAAA